ncbi:uncharacterized protein K460DRAFT_350161 [Cucurbitaria berberidis CBS 394.84]|uniref:Uncharacterized protein n=1 Tax=Cucurbitaria berberidis CBS 394.84 TaxID=1168544 RepID=A0A9P4LDF5_9PLEO|nr:uncharacterized protein K460DRAFT_350161 [Cucurbitaria berberidis CBS 394.84]KAF1850054.1 hypothetical protein K460DRAFT_350161 [Cucurbitaria berberidis CBS 394.84]
MSSATQQNGLRSPVRSSVAGYTTVVQPAFESLPRKLSMTQHFQQQQREVRPSNEVTAPKRKIHTEPEHCKDAVSKSMKRKRGEESGSDGKSSQKKSRHDTESNTKNVSLDNDPNRKSAHSSPRNEDSTRENADWSPKWWYPDAIQEADFFHEAGFALVGDNTPSGYPCLVLTANLYHTIWNALCGIRELECVRSQWEPEFDKISRQIEATNDANCALLTELQDTEQLLEGLYDPEARNNLVVSFRIAEEKYDGTRRERARLLEQQKPIARELENVTKKTKDIQHLICQRLDSIFWDAGVLPDIEAINEAPSVPVFELDPSPNKELASASSEVGSDLTQCKPFSPIDVLWRKLRELGSEVHRTEVEFNSFRDGFDAELHQYIAQELKKSRDKKPTVADLEQEFGPIWLTRHLELTRKKAAADEAYYEADGMFMDAKRAAKLASSQDEPERYGMADEETAMNFGMIISLRKIRRIETWLHDNDVVPDTAVNHSGDVLEEDAVDDKHSVASGESKVTLAEGWLRRRIDDYDRYVGRV